MSGRSERFLATILFTDMVKSTDLAVRIGDASWRRLVAAHHATVRRNLRKFGGHEQDTAGDGFFASFDQPAQAVRAADAILTDVSALGLTLRAGVHTGECERVGTKLGGIAVTIAARVMSNALDDEVLVSGTVRDLVAGSGLAFDERGTHELKGVPGEWRLFGLQRQKRAPADQDAAQQAAIAAVAAGDARRQRQRRNVALATGVVALAVLLGGGAVLGGFLGGPPAILAAPGPDSVATIESASGKITEIRQVAAGPQSVIAADNALWISALDSAVLVSLPITGFEGQSTIGRVGRPLSLAVGGGYVWVSDPFTKTVSLVDQRSGDVTRTMSVMARDIVFGFDSAWAADDLGDSVLRLDRQTGDTVATIALPAGAYPAGLAVGAGAVWVANPGTSTVTRIDPSNNTVTAAAIPLRGVPSAIAATDTDVWILSRASDMVLRLDPSSGSVTLTVPDVCDEPSTVLADAESVWVGCAGSSPALIHLSPDGAKLSRVALGGVPTSLAAGTNGHLYLTVRAP